MDFGVIVSKRVLLFLSFIFCITLGDFGFLTQGVWISQPKNIPHGDVVEIKYKVRHIPRGPYLTWHPKRATWRLQGEGAAAGLLYVGTNVLNTYEQYDTYLQNRDVLLPPILIIVVAVVMLVIGIVGCCATLRESKISLGVLLVILLLIFIAEMATFVVVFVYKEKVEADFHDSMLKSFAAYDGESENSHTVDYLQQSLQCCGVHNYTDWIGTRWFNTIGNHSLPLSCCKYDPTLEECTGQLSEKHLLNTQGCEQIMNLPVLLTEVRDVLRDAMFIVLAFAIVKFFGMLAICVLAYKKESKRVSIPEHRSVCLTKK